MALLSLNCLILNGPILLFKFKYSDLRDHPDTYGGKIETLIPCLDPWEGLLGQPKGRHEQEIHCFVVVTTPHKQMA